MAVVLIRVHKSKSKGTHGTQGTPGTQEALEEILVELTYKGVKIGRSSTCDLVIPDKKCSKLHFSAILEADKILIRDMGSFNGTYINGIKIAKSYIYLQDIIKAGDSFFTLDPRNMTELERSLYTSPKKFGGSGSIDIAAMGNEFPYPKTEKERESKTIKTKDLKLDFFQVNLHLKSRKK